MFLLLTIIYFIYAANGVTVVLTFDDGLQEHYQVYLDLESRHVKASFFINSMRIGTPNYLTKSQLDIMHSNGHEIGGHTLNHANLSSLSYTAQETEICNDRDRLLELGYNVTNFVYPFGIDTAESFSILSNCGYNGARDSGGIRSNTSCLSCPKSENQIFSNPLQIRSVPYYKNVGVNGMKWYVTSADEDILFSSGVLVFIFHEYGNYPTVSSAISPTELLEFVDWLKQRNTSIALLNNFTRPHVYPNFKNMNYR